VNERVVTFISIV